MGQSKYMAQNIYLPDKQKKKNPSRRTQERKTGNSEAQALRREFMQYKRETDIELEELRKKAGKT